MLKLIRLLIEVDSRLGEKFVMSIVVINLWGKVRRRLKEL